MEENICGNIFGHIAEPYFVLLLINCLYVLIFNKSKRTKITNKIICKSLIILKNLR